MNTGLGAASLPSLLERRVLSFDVKCSRRFRWSISECPHLFMPMRPAGSASQMNSRSISTASPMISDTRSCDSLFATSLQAVRVCCQQLLAIYEACGIISDTPASDSLSSHGTYRNTLMTEQICGSSKKLAKNVRVEEAGEIAVEALVPRDELVGEGEPRHQPPLFQPEDGAEAAQQGDTSMSVSHCG